MKRPLFGLALAVAFGLLMGCQSPAGMYCQQQSECRVGLICLKPPGTATDTSFGVCAPALRGQGESCLRHDDCQSGLRCSNEAGEDNGDERHGICELDPTIDAGAVVDMGVSDL
jgi:hypothetical protein